MGGPSQQPYFLRALYEWCVDCNLTPYITVQVDHRTQVPQAYVRDNQIVLNVGPSAVRNIHIDNVWVTFSARFGGISHDIEIPVGNVLAIYAKETGEGMSFEHLLSDDDEDATASIDAGESAATGQESEDEPSPPQPPKGKPQLRVVK